MKLRRINMYAKYKLTNICAYIPKAHTDPQLDKAILSFMVFHFPSFVEPMCNLIIMGYGDILMTSIIPSIFTILQLRAQHAIKLQFFKGGNREGGRGSLQVREKEN